MAYSHNNILQIPIILCITSPFFVKTKKTYFDGWNRFLCNSGSNSTQPIDKNVGGHTYPRVPDCTYNLRRKNQKPISTIKIGLFCFNKEWTCNA